MLDTIQTAIGELPKRSLAAGDTLIEEDSETGVLYFLASGEMEVEKNGIRIADVSEEGAAFGEMSVLLNTKHTATVRARVASEVHVVEDPTSFLLDNPLVMFYLAELLARRLDALNRYLVDVKRQFGDDTDHLAMLDEILDTLMTKHPRKIERRDPTGP